MKRIMLTGAMIGFATGFGLGLIRRIPTQDAFWHACVAAYAGGMSFRWWGRLWLQGLRESYEERLAATAAEETPDTPLVSGRP